MGGPRTPEGTGWAPDALLTEGGSGGRAQVAPPAAYTAVLASPGETGDRTQPPHPHPRRACAPIDNEAPQAALTCFPALSGVTVRFVGAALFTSTFSVTKILPVKLCVLNVRSFKLAAQTRSALL